MAVHWYALHTYSGHENKVKTYLEALVEQGAANGAIAKVVVPTEEVVEMRAGKKTVSKRRFLPSYVLIELEMTKDAWYVVTNVPGVTNFVGPARKPSPLTQEEVDHILGHADRRKSQDVEDIPYIVGDQVKVNDGAFKDFIGTVEEVIPEKRRLKIMVSIFGRGTPVELDVLQVENVDESVAS
ncbi:MAG: transcription termination/antitermination factor NusG [Gemmatimonadetes bacterium]|jgi:transcription termination/antitermination protein NusG|nr:transcription termination/antitermination factor NusG [Gemmatimonadota bacterium]MBT7861536.1 transcription termination/antitermination factor NusG [Gemmatimonadota bacterium]